MSIKSILEAHYGKRSKEVPGPGQYELTNSTSERGNHVIFLHDGPSKIPGGK